MEELEGVSPQELNEFNESDELLHQTQLGYLKEVDVASGEWAGLSEEAKETKVENAKLRIDELLNSSRSKSLEELEKRSSTNLLSPELLEQVRLRLEAPNDIEQIEQVSDVMSKCEEIRLENWKELNPAEKVGVLNGLEKEIAKIEHRPPCKVTAIPLESNQLGGYNPDTKSIMINQDYVENNDKYYDVLDTIVHEGRHAYQDYNVNVRRVHPRQSEVESWQACMPGGKWSYWGDCSTLLGQRLYEQQSIEIDARNYASDVMTGFRDKMPSQVMASNISFGGWSEDARDSAKSRLLDDLHKSSIYPGTVYTDSLWGGLDSYSGRNIRDEINRARNNGRIKDSEYDKLMGELKAACHYQ